MKHRRSISGSWIIGFGMAIFMTGFLGGLPAFAGAGLDQESVGKCKECHATHVEKFLSESTHAKFWKKKAGDVAYSCETCHGSGEKHSKDKELDSILSFGKASKQTSQDQNKACLTCHSTKNKDLMFWDQGVHNQNQVSCASCHKMHKGQALEKPTSETCFTCHKDVKTDSRKISHHPIIEGKVSCVDCHNPHGSLNHGELQNDNVNQLCFKCHTDKRGPFVYGHLPVEENCLNCHRSHGSSHPKLLTEELPSLCQNCHDASSHVGQAFAASTEFSAGTKVSLRTVGKSCNNCHNMVHGSNVPSSTGIRFIR